jgi:hypothetical protein
MNIDTSVYSHEFDSFIEHLHDYFGDEFGKDHIKYLIDFLLEEATFYESELELYDE